MRRSDINILDALPQGTESGLAASMPKAVNFRALPPLALYIHIPWCVRKCPYCDFNSHEARGGVPEREYVTALIADLDQALPLIWGRRVCSVFFGGGTPSLLSPQGVDAILSMVRARLPLTDNAEITLEANPGTFETEKFRQFRVAGINRLSVGIQSFNAGHLKALGRIHDQYEARRAVEIAHEHFENFNLDLMYGLPHQTPEEACVDIKTALGFAPPHLSVYHLTIEPNTHFHRFPPQLPDDDAAATMQMAIEALLAEHGYEHYETSAFARSGARSRHNLNYWTFGDYLGIGAGAHSKLSFPHRVVRQLRFREPQKYIAQALAGMPVAQDEEVPREQLPFE
ncbi:MAG TPA: radical SAM family heme chaperone HemW, partial [Burkholderiales bacterium]|nr:radical SAM family heme chaperone HemW [Burkholderiales bacterium]